MLLKNQSGGAQNYLLFLANEEVVDGKSEVGNHPVERRKPPPGSAYELPLMQRNYSTGWMIWTGQTQPSASKRLGLDGRKVQKLNSL